MDRARRRLVIDHVQEDLRSKSPQHESASLVLIIFTNTMRRLNRDHIYLQESTHTITIRLGGF